MPLPPPPPPVPPSPVPPSQSPLMPASSQPPQPPPPSSSGRRPGFGLGGIAFAGLILGLLIWGAVTLARPRPADTPIRATLSAAEALGGAGADIEGFSRAMGPRPFRFPEDHGAHPSYRTEWWYLTGHLDGVDEGAPGSFGFQLTFFRNALSPDPPAEGGSAWRTNQLWMGHFALTDVVAGQHVYAERFARGGAGLAGALADPFRVWLEDWELASVGAPSMTSDSPQAIFPLRLRASHNGVRLDLELDAGKLPVLQGDAGWSQKGAEAGNASFYLSWTRMPLRGTVEIDGRVVAVEGTGWMDREWSTSALDAVHVGWDWFSIQLDDGRELMFFELRRSDGLRDPQNHGTWVDVAGGVRPLGASDVILDVLEQWESPLDGARYPSGWRLQVPAEGIDLRLTPRVRNQEMNVSVRYWEGALDVTGTGPSGALSGRGYAELTGYAERPAAPEGGASSADARARGGSR